MNAEIWRAVCFDGELDTALYLALKSTLTYDDLLDILEMREITADHIVAAEIEAEATARDKAARQAAERAAR